MAKAATQTPAPEKVDPPEMVKRSGEHRASFSRDQKTGSWIICVVGPNAHRFAGRTIPVKLYSGEENPEKLNKLLWSGEFPSTGEHAATYSFVQREKKPIPLDDEIPF